MSYFSKKDKEILKPLLIKARELAASKENQIKISRWHDVNEHIKPDSPPIYMMFDPPAWEEILPGNSLECESAEARNLENELKKHFLLFKFGDDTPIRKKLYCPAIFDVYPENQWGVEVKVLESVEETGSYRIEPPLKTPEDLDLLTVPEFTCNKEKTDARMEKMLELSQGVFEVEKVATPPMLGILTRYAGELRGLGELMMDFAVNPRLVHRLMDYLMKAHFSAMKAVEDAGMVSPGFRDPWYEADSFGPGPINGKYSFKNCWVRIHGQEFEPVSPVMWDEFLLPYLSRISERYGKAEFGCCESLTKRIDSVLKVPNLALVVLSIFSNMDKIIEAVGDKHVLQWRQHPTHLFFENDLTTVKKTLEEGFKKFKGCHFQIALREIVTFNKHVDHLEKFSLMVREFAARG